MDNKDNIDNNKNLSKTKPKQGYGLGSDENKKQLNITEKVTYIYKNNVLSSIEIREKQHLI